MRTSSKRERRSSKSSSACSSNTCSWTRSSSFSIDFTSYTHISLNIYHFFGLLIYIFFHDLTFSCSLSPSLMSSERRWILKSSSSTLLMRALMSCIQPAFRAMEFLRMPDNSGWNLSMSCSSPCSVMHSKTRSWLKHTPIWAACINEESCMNVHEKHIVQNVIWSHH